MAKTTPEQKQFYKQLAENLKLIRTETKTSTKTMASLLNVSLVSYWKYEKGKARLPTFAVAKIMSNFGLEFNDLVPSVN